MDSRSNEDGDHWAAQRLFDAVQSVLEDCVGNGVSATCDIYLSDRTGQFLARRRFQTCWDNPWQVVVSQEPPESGQAPTTGKTEMGIDSVTPPSASPSGTTK